MVAHYHGQTWNAAEPARALGVSESTARRHLDLLTDALMIRQLQPYHANLSKRQVKSPKVYVRDSGLLHRLLGIDTLRALHSHPKLGASWEGFAIEQVLGAEPHDEAFFWATHQGAEIDLILRRGSRLLGVQARGRASGHAFDPGAEAHRLDELHEAVQDGAELPAQASRAILRPTDAGGANAPSRQPSSAMPGAQPPDGA